MSAVEEYVGPQVINQVMMDINDVRTQDNLNLIRTNKAKLKDLEEQCDLQRM